MAETPIHLSGLKDRFRRARRKALPRSGGETFWGRMHDPWRESTFQPDREAGDQMRASRKAATCLVFRIRKA